jgi:cysteinyl-tRNA synthetase
VAALDDDLDTPTALRIARETLRAALPPDERRWLVLDMDFVLGLDLDLAGLRAGRAGVRTGDEELPDGARSLLDARTAARAGREWATADRLRDDLADLGVEPIDRADGTSDWRRRR